MVERRINQRQESISKSCMIQKQIEDSISKEERLSVSATVDSTSKIMGLKKNNQFFQKRMTQPLRDQFL